jgi:hypothetical protein
MMVKDESCCLQFFYTPMSYQDADGCQKSESKKRLRCQCVRIEDLRQENVFVQFSSES